ncbi:MAG: hypothetical protein ACRDRJ_45540, partial [Streptosporangiaceae bacterium]
ALSVASCSAGAAARPGNVFDTRQQVSLSRVQRDLGALYRGHPGIASFSAQDVQYTAQSRDTVLRECTAGTASAAQTAENTRIIACAPLIFFLYSYGRQASVPSAVSLAGELYWYAVTHISGPASPRISLDEVLSSWKLPVPALSAAQQRTARLASVISAAGDSILGQKSVHIVITSRSAGGASQRIAADIGTAAGAESITGSAGRAAIRVTGHAAYFTGSPTGLTAYIGLPAAAAARVRSRWVEIKPGSAEYQDLAAEDTMADLPASLLPSASNSVRMRTGTISGQQAYVLTWKATPSGSSTTISAQLRLTAGRTVLPVSETLTGGGQTKELTLSHWAERFGVPVPGSTVPYSLLVSRR